MDVCHGLAALAAAKFIFFIATLRNSVSLVFDIFIIIAVIQVMLPLGLC